MLCLINVILKHCIILPSGIHSSPFFSSILGLRWSSGVFKLVGLVLRSPSALYSLVLADVDGCYSKGYILKV